MLEIALTLLRLGAAESMRSAGRRLGVTLVCGLLAAMAAATAAGCIMAAAWLALLPALGPGHRSSSPRYSPACRLRWLWRCAGRPDVTRGAESRIR
jgi:hypothetical protein